MLTMLICWFQAGNFEKRLHQRKIAKGYFVKCSHLFQMWILGVFLERLRMGRQGFVAVTGFVSGNLIGFPEFIKGLSL